MNGFPDPIEAVIELVKTVEPNTVRWLTSLDVLPCVNVVQIATPAATPSWERLSRLRVDVYTRDPDQALHLADKILALLDGKPHATSHGLLDQIVCEIAPYPVAYPDDQLSQYSFQLRVIARIQTITRKE